MDQEAARLHRAIGQRLRELRHQETGLSQEKLAARAGFHRTYVGKLERGVEVCWGTTCHLLGAMPLIEEVLAAIGLENEGDTPDGRVSFRLNTCLGACAQAPVMSIDHHLMGRLSPESARAKINGLLG